MKRLVEIVFSLIIIFVAILPVLALDATVINDVVIDEAGRLIVVKTNKDDQLPKPDVSRLVEPNRLVMDIPDSILGMKPKVINVNSNGVSQVRVSQFKSDDDKIVRIVVETDNNKQIDNIKISAGRGSSMIQLEKLPSGGTNNFIDNGNLTKITKINYRDNQLIIGALSSLRIKEPFILQGPTRLVVDIPNAVVSDKNLLTPITVGENNVDVIRIGQFDDSTVRIVIETDTPNRLSPIYGADQQTLFITSDPLDSIANLPTGASQGYIKSIKVSEDRGLGTIIKIESSAPIFHSVKRIHNPEKLILDLFNAEPPSDAITRDIEVTDELLGIKVGQLMAGNPNSRMVLDLGGPNVDVRTNVSVDSKVIEIVLKQGSDLLALPSDGKSIKVVIDPGHGGYDPGCQADGYKEKDIVLDVSKRLKLLLEKSGIKVYMTRTTDLTLSLKERVEFTNNINPAAFVSVHVNASTSSAPEGIDTHWYTNQSIPLARSIQNSLMKKINAVDRGIKKNMFYVVHHTPVPAVLVEIGFLSNPKERRDILSHKRKQETANGIAEGVLKFLGTKYSFSGSQLQR